MEEFCSEFKSTLLEEEIILLNQFNDEFSMFPEQCYHWVNISSTKNNCYYFGRYKNKLVTTCIINESNNIARILFGPVFSDKKFIIDSIIAIKNHYNKNFGLLTIQLPIQSSQESTFIEYGLYNKIRFSQEYDTENWSSIKIDLSLDEEDIWKSIKPNHKGSIKKAKKMGAYTKAITTKNEIHKLSILYDQMYINRGLVNTFSDTSKVFQQILEDKNINSIILGVYSPDNILIGGVICPIINNTIHYKIGVTDFNYRKYAALHLALYSIILQAKILSLNWFDLGGYNHFVKESDQISKINLFKRSFGGEHIFFPNKIYIKLNPLTYFYTSILRKTYFIYLSLKNKWR